MKALLQKLVDRLDLTPAEVESAFEAILQGEATPAQMGAFLVALRMKGETPAEIAAAATVMRRRATPVRTPPGRVVLDTCGTGGDGAGTFNISTAAALVVAGAGRHRRQARQPQRVLAERQRRSPRRVRGPVDAPVEVVERCLAEVRIGFLYAPALHGAMRHVGPVRREVGVRSIFNLLGPLANPARATRQLLGVYAAPLVPVVAETLARLGTERALVVHGLEGLDEISPSGPTRAAWVEAGQVREVTIQSGGRWPEARSRQARSGAERRRTTRGSSPGCSAARPVHSATRCCSTQAPRSGSPMRWRRSPRACSGPRRASTRGRRAPGWSAWSTLTRAGVAA